VRIVALKKTARTYSCNAYLLLGDWNRVGDVNTLIDPGIDDFVVAEIERLSTGFGKLPVQQILLTHNHFDHAAGAGALKARYGARILAAVDGPGVDELLPDGCFLKAGDDFLEVLHTPVHSSDSLCFYAPAIKALFSGDMQLKPQLVGDDCRQEYLAAMKKLANRDIVAIYSGHDHPIVNNCNTMIREILAGIRGNGDRVATANTLAKNDNHEANTNKHP
jgi:glyoxylase-like metal-dependent hydrolase (beta-lactamase superfamily II)